MPKFLSDLEVQGKISAASAEIEDLIVDGNATFHGAPVFDEGMPDFKQGFCVDSAYSFYRLPQHESCGVYLDGGITFSRDDNPTRSILFFSEKENTTISVLGDFCVKGDFCLKCGTFSADGVSAYSGEFSSLSVNDLADLCHITASTACISESLVLEEGSAFVGDIQAKFCIHAVPLCIKTALGADAYGLSVSRDGGLQLWGTHFLRGSVWSNDTLKIVHNDLSLGATDKAFLGFDYANEVNFRTFPNDGTEATYCFVANQWMDDSHKYYKPAGVRLKKANQVSAISDEDVLNAGEGDQRWLGYDMDLDKTIRFISCACSTDHSLDEGVLINDAGVPLRVKGDACVGGIFTVYSKDFKSLGTISSDSSYDGKKRFIINSADSDLCVVGKSLGFATNGSTNALSINDSGVEFRSGTQFCCNVYADEEFVFQRYPKLSDTSTDTVEDNSFITKSYVDNRLSSVYSFKGTKAKVSDLASITTKAKGDVYNVTEDGMNYAWDGTAWDALGGDFSRYYTKTEIDTKLGGYANLSGNNRFTGSQEFCGGVNYFRAAVFCTAEDGHLIFSNGRDETFFSRLPNSCSFIFKTGNIIGTEEDGVTLDPTIRGGKVVIDRDNTDQTLHGNYHLCGNVSFEGCLSTINLSAEKGDFCYQVMVFGTGPTEGAVLDRSFCMQAFDIGVIRFARWGDTTQSLLMKLDNPGTLAIEEDHYDRATIDGVTTGANVLPKMNEVIGYLEDYEEKTGEKLPLELYEETVKAIEEWQKDPTVEKTWNTSSDGTSTNPYYAEAPKKPVVDLNVVQAKGVNALYPSFSLDTDVDLFLPASTDISQVIRAGTRFNNYLICPNATLAYAALYRSTSFNKPLYLKSATDCAYLLSEDTKFNSFAILPNCKKAEYAFSNTAMSAENISKTLDSLPTLTDGARHAITFSRSAGASELNQSSPSVAAAVAKGWTVEL